MSSIIQTTKNTCLLAIAAWGGWIGGFKMGQAEARDEDLNGVVCEIVAHRIILALTKNSYKKRLLTYYWEGQVVAALNHYPDWKP